MGYAYFECNIVLAVADGESEANGIIVVFDGVPDDLFHRSAKGAGGIFHVGKPADKEAGETGQFTVSPELAEHAVDIVAVFTYIFKEKELVRRIDIRPAADEMGQ